MIEYNKIETIFERDTEGTKKLIEGKFRNKTVEFLQSNQWDFTEKIDGTNIRVHWNGHKVEFGGRTDSAQIPTPLVNKLNEMFSGDINEELFEQKFGENDVILFGEGYGAKIQSGGDYIPNGVSFILFDVMVNNIYLQRQDIEDVAKFFNVDVVPIIFTGRLDEAVQYVKQHLKSTVGVAYMEGLVGRPIVEMKDRLGKRVIVKIKYKDFC